ncbi:hypothetical protein G6L87_18085 [Agrobacterium rhizogenes]|nr:hypothetical protein [Rhizobium rhizogenes]
MTQVYHVYCMDCGEWLSIGKAQRIYDGRLEQTVYGFASICDGHSNDYNGKPEWVRDLFHREWRYLDHFLMRHRGHELRVLPEELAGRFENDTFPYYRPEDPTIIDGAPEENYYLTPTGIPDQTQDAMLTPQSVKERLRELSKGVEMGKPIWDSEDCNQE